LKDEVRLAVARELLARTDIAISDVAAALGYATPSAFVRAFRRWTGGSPSAWRKEHRTEAV
jgi:AraC-like DNA-binding protein